MREYLRTGAWYIQLNKSSICGLQYRLPLRKDMNVDVVACIYKRDLWTLSEEQ